MDDESIELLRNTVEQHPELVGLRVNLATVLLNAGRFDEALDQARRCLTSEPANVDALRIAHSSAASKGDLLVAEGYRALLAGLEPATDDQNTTDVGLEESRNGEPSSGRSTSGGGEAAGDRLEPTPETVDELLRLWNNDPIEEAAASDPEMPGLTLADVAGLEQVKSQLEASFLMPLRNRELRRAFGSTMRGGLLLWGPPGCGKTFIARAIAGELGASFVHFGLADVLDMFVGSSERNLAEAFGVARASAPCVLFLDEIDALGLKRTQLQGSLRNVVNQLLTELDGVEGNNDGLYVLAATNHPWDLDSALLRSGRFDRSILVLPPDLPARRAILRRAMRTRLVDRVDLDAIAQRTEGFSASDVVRVAQQAAEFALLDSARSGVIRPIAQGDLDRATGMIKPSHQAWVETARNVARYGNASGFYDDLAAWIDQLDRKRR